MIHQLPDKVIELILLAKKEKKSKMFAGHFDTLAARRSWLLVLCTGGFHFLAARNVEHETTVSGRMDGQQSTDVGVCRVAGRHCTCALEKFKKNGKPKR